MKPSLRCSLRDLCFQAQRVSFYAPASDDAGGIVFFRFFVRAYVGTAYECTSVCTNMRTYVIL